MDKSYIEDLASEFQSALKYVSKKGLYGSLTLFQSFPNGCCTYASDLLAEYLMYNGIDRERIQLVNSESNSMGYTHCWLMIDEILFVDITADQFNGKPYFQQYEPIPQCCIVQQGTYLFECFTNRKIRFSRSFGISSYGGDIPSKLQVVYDAAVQVIENWRQRR